ncbi:MAG: protease modulator HflC [Planctomycetota bacterium]|jgi:membrane protease subunit HflC
MKNIAITLLIVLLVAALGLYLVAFQVRETESALVIRFGEAVRQYKDEPGLKFKWPVPIEQLVKYDSRLRVYNAELDETTTKGAVPIIVHTYIVWRVDEPLTFFKAVGTVREANSKLYSQISDVQNRVIGRHSFGEFVNSDKSKIKFGEIEQEMLDELKNAVGEDYGIEIKTLGIKRLMVAKDVTQSVFSRMQAERARRTEATVAQGNAEATAIRSDADMKKTEILAAAESRAMEIRGKGDAEAAKYYEMLEADEELAMFLRDIKALKTTLEKKATIVISADTEPFNLLREMPKIKPGESIKTDN